VIDKLAPFHTREAPKGTDSGAEWRVAPWASFAVEPGWTAGMDGVVSGPGGDSRPNRGAFARPAKDAR
jgi:hypothetical protein